MANPNHYFHERSQRWQSSLMDELAVLRIKKNNAAIEECTFRPNVRQLFVGNKGMNHDDTRDDRTEKRLFNARWNSDEKRSHRGSKVAQARCEEMYREASSKFQMIDSMHKVSLEQRNKNDMQECTFRPFAHVKKSEVVKNDGIKEKLQVKGEGFKSEGKENNQKDSTDTLERLTYNPAAHLPPSKSPGKTRWNSGAKLTKQEFEASFLHRQNLYAETKDSRVNQIAESVEEEMSRPARGKGHWLKSYATCKRNAEGYLMKNPKGIVRLRSDSYWNVPKFHDSKEKSVGQGLLYIPEFDERNEMKDGQDGTNKMGVATGSIWREGSGGAANSQVLSTSRNSAWEEQDEATLLVHRTGKGVRQILGSPPGGRVDANALSDFIEASLWHAEMEERGGVINEGGKDKIRRFARGFEAWETGVEGWIWVVKGVEKNKKGSKDHEAEYNKGILGAEIGGDELKAGYKIMLRQDKAGSGREGNGDEDLADVVEWMAWVSGSEDGGVKGSVLRDVVQIYGRGKKETDAIEKVMADVTRVDEELKDRGGGVLKFFEAGKLKEDEIIKCIKEIPPIARVAEKERFRAEANEVGSTGGGSKALSYIKHTTGKAAKMSPSTGRYSTRSSELRRQNSHEGGGKRRRTGSTPGRTPKGGEASAPKETPKGSTPGSVEVKIKSPDRKGTATSIASPTKRIDSRVRRSLATHESFVSSSTKAHRGISNQLHQTRQEHKKDGLYDRIMGKLMDDSCVGLPEDADKSGEGVKSFVSKLGLHEDEKSERRRREKREKKKEKKKRKKEEKKKAREMKVEGVSEIEDVNDDEEEGWRKEMVEKEKKIEFDEKAKTVEAPKVLMVMSHSNENPFQKLHIQRETVADVKRLVKMEREIGRRVAEEEDKKRLEEEMLEWSMGRAGGFDAPVLHQTKEYQEKLTNRLNVPLERNKYKGPPVVRKGYENMAGRQRPNPEIPVVPEAKFNKKMTQKEWLEWKKIQDEKVLRNRIGKERMLNEEIAEQTKKYSVSDASRVMLRPEMEPSEGYGKGAIFKELYKEGVTYVIDKKHEKPSEYLHKPTAHLENEVTQEILSSRKGFKRDVNYYTRPRAEAEPEKPSFQPEMPEKSKEIIESDPRFMVPYDVREGRRVDKWVEERMKKAEEEKETRSGLEVYGGNNHRRGSALLLSFPSGGQ